MFTALKSSFLKSQPTPHRNQLSGLMFSWPNHPGTGRTKGPGLLDCQEGVPELPDVQKEAPDYNAGVAVNARLD